MSQKPTLTPSMQKLADLLEAVDSDNLLISNAVASITDAVARARQLSAGYEESWLAERDALVASYGTGVTPRVLSEDAVFDAITEHDLLMRRLLKVVASSVAMDAD